MMEVIPSNTHQHKEIHQTSTPRNTPSIQHLSISTPQSNDQERYLKRKLHFNETERVSKRPKPSTPNEEDDDLVLIQTPMDEENDVYTLPTYIKDIVRDDKVNTKMLKQRIKSNHSKYKESYFWKIHFGGESYISQEMVLEDSIIYREHINCSILKTILVLLDVPDCDAERLCNVKDKHNVDLIIELFTLLQIKLSAGGINNALSKYRVDHSSQQAQKLKIMLNELHLFTSINMLIIGGHFHAEIGLQDRLIMILSGAIQLKVLWFINRCNLFSKDAIFAILAHVTCLVQTVYQMQNHEVLRHCEYLLLYVGSDLSERLHFLLRTAIAHIKQLNHQSIHHRIKYVDHMLRFSIKYPDLSYKRKRVKSGDKMNYASYNSNLYVKDVNLLSVITEAKEKALSMIRSHFEDDVYIDMKKIMMDYDLCVFDYKNDSERRYNILEFTDKERQKYKKKIKEYNEALEMYLTHRQDSTLQQIFAECVDENTSPELADKVRELNERAIQLTYNERKSLSAICDPDIEVNVELEQQLNMKTMEFEKPICDRYIYIQQNNEYNNMDKGTKIHKTAILNELFNKNRVKYCTDRQLLLQRVATNVKKKKLEKLIDFDTNETIVIGQNGVAVVQSKLGGRKKLLCALVQVKTIACNNVKTHSVSINSLSTTKFKIMFCLRVCTTVDATGTIDIAWNGGISGESWWIEPNQCLFPSFSHHENEQNIISITATELIDFCNMIRIENKSKSFVSIASSTAEFMGLPYTDCLQFDHFSSTKRISRSLTNASKTKLGSADMDEVRLCRICINHKITTFGAIKLHDFPFHIMWHITQKHIECAEEQQDDNKHSYLCYFCAASSPTICNLKIIRNNNGKFEITADCVAGTMTNKYFNFLRNISAKHAWCNVPKQCVMSGCHMDIWKWNLSSHLIHNHGIALQNIGEDHIVSDFEINCVKYQRNASYIKDDQFEDLSKRFPEQTASLFEKRIDKEKEKELKKQKKKEAQKKQKKKKTQRKAKQNDALIKMYCSKSKKKTSNIIDMSSSSSGDDDIGLIEYAKKNKNYKRFLPSSESGEDSD